MPERQSVLDAVVKTLRFGPRSAQNIATISGFSKSTVVRVLRKHTERFKKTVEAGQQPGHNTAALWALK